jgi:hypothetical protein
MKSSRFRHIRVVAAIGVFIAITSFAVMALDSSRATADQNGVFQRAGSLETLKSARGVIADWAQTYDTTNGYRDWIIDGEWILNCHEKCTSANVAKIDFDMAFAMYRESVKEEANNSHGHPFWDFSATNVTLVGDTLTITGDITGSGEIGEVGIVITLRQHSSHFTFVFTIEDDNSLATEVSGAVVESKGP